MPLGRCVPSTASLLVNYSPPRITRKSCRPRASDRTMVDTFQPHSLSCFRIRERRHDNKMNLEKEKALRDSQHAIGWTAQRTFSLLPVAGEIFLLTLPFYRTALSSKLILCVGSSTYVSDLACTACELLVNRPMRPQSTPFGKRIP